MSAFAELDFSSLVDPISGETVAVYRQWSEEHHAPHPSSRRLLGGSIFQLIWSCTLVLAGLAVSAGVLSILSEGVWSVGEIIGVVLAAAALGAGFIGYAAWGVAKRMSVGSPWHKRARMAQFAATNGFSYSAVSDGPRISSSIIVHDATSRATDQFVLGSGPHIEVGNFSRVAIAEGGAQRQTWGYIAIDLGVQLPHIVVRSLVVIRKYPAMTIPGEFGPSQVLHLEGDFGRHFALFAPTGYGRDALYIFTPDLMSILIDEAHELEVEIIDRWLLLYSPKPLDLSQPTTFERVLRIASVVGVKALRQTGRYNDDRTPDSTVAPAGRRLRSEIAVFSIVITVVWIVVNTARVLLMTH